MAQLPSRADGELVVAAIRILEHLEKHPPTEEEIAGLLRWHEDRTRVLARELEECGILGAIKSPFEMRYKLRAPEKVAALPADPSVADDISQEMEDFDARAAAEQERIEKLLGADKAKVDPPSRSALEDEFGDFKRKKPRDPFSGD